MATPGWCTKDLAPPTCSAKVRQRFLQPFQHGALRTPASQRRQSPLSSRPSRCRRERVSGLPALITVWARVASEPSMSCSFIGSHEDHDKRCADQAGSHSVHVDGRLRRPTGGATLGVVESHHDLGLTPGFQLGTRRGGALAHGRDDSDERPFTVSCVVPSLDLRC